MNELQTALAIAGLVVFLIVLIISYDKFRIHRIRGEESRIKLNSALRKGPTIPEDVSVDLDPPQSGKYSLLSPKPQQETGPREIPEFKDPLQQEIEDAERFARTPIHGVTALHAFPDDEYLDGPAVELVARLPGSNLVKRDTALGLYRQHEFDLKKPHHIFGLSHPSRTWVDLEQAPATALFTDFGVAIQMVDRDGPISESELNQYTQMILRFAEVFGRRFKFSMELDKVIAHANKVDEMCKKYDSLAILNVLTRDSGFRGDDIDRHARELGMRITRRHIYQKAIRENNEVRYLYSLANLYGSGAFEETPSAKTTGGITLFMNIPRTKSPSEVFEQMVMDAKELCRRLDGKLVDQNKRGMTENGISAINDQINRIASDMQKDGIEPGGLVAHKLF